MAILANTPPLKVYWHNPQPIFVARVNLASATYPIQDIPYDGVTVGAYTDLAADQFFTLGSAEGLDDRGRGRLRATPTATILKVGRSSQGISDGELSVVNDSWIHVYDDWRVHAKISSIGFDFVEYKDSDLTVSDLTLYPPPIANTGPPVARSIDPDTGLLRVFLPGSTSLAVADGATITTYAWDIKDGSFALGSVASDDDIFVDFPAGFRWVALTVTDSNGKTNTSRVFVLADDPEDSLCVSGMQLQNLTRSRQGSSIRLRTLVDLPRADYPDSGLVVVWEDRIVPPDPESRADLVFWGWHQSDDASSRAQETHLQRDTTLTCIDVAGRLDVLPGLAQRIEVPEEGDPVTWGTMPTANMDKFLCYLIHWHSTAAGLADFFPSGTWADYRFVLFDAPGGSLYEQLQRQAARIVPDHIFTCNRYGQLRVLPDPMLQNLADRTATVQGTLTEPSWSEISFGYQRPPRVRTLRGSALATQTAWLIVEGEKELESPFFAIAPGTAPGQGVQEQTLGERLAQSQQYLNDCVGHHLARLNARYGPITAIPSLNYDPHTIECADMTWLNLVTTATTAPQRGIDFATARCLPTQVSIDYSYGDEGTMQRTRVMLELETVGLPALTEEQEEALPVGEEPLVTIPPDMGLIGGQELVAGIGSDGYIYRTSDFQTPSGSGGPTWDRVDTTIADTIYSWVVDPFSPGYAPGATSGAINGWIVNDTDIYRVTDLFGTPAAASVFTFATPTVAASFHWRSIQASFGAYFAEGVNPWLLCVSYYGDTVGHTGTWATHSLDGGVTWSTEVQISEHYDQGIATRFSPIGVYTSPKTPGLAITAAYVSVEDDPDHPLPRWGILDGDNIFTLGDLSAAANITAALNLSGSGASIIETQHLMLGPPADTKRVEISGIWSMSAVDVGTTTVVSVAFNDEDANLTTVTDFVGQTESVNGSWAGAFTMTITKSGAAAWPGNRDTFLSSPPNDTSDAVRFRAQVSVGSRGVNDSASVDSMFGVVVIEIELDDGTIYTPAAGAVAGYRSTDWGMTWAETALIAPGQGQGGTIHLPWILNADEQLGFFGSFDNTTNREFRLKQSSAGTITDISPVATAISYGPNRFGFGIRAYDSDRQFLAMGGIGNDTTSDPADDKVGLWVSSNAGTGWVNILAPVAASNALNGLEIAFGADDPDVLFAWGGWSNAASLAAIYYSSNFGVSLDDRSGNLESSFGSVAFIGIAGGAG